MRTNAAKIFVILLGSIFIIAGIIISAMFEALDVVSIGMGIIGIFLILLPFTSVVNK